MDGLNIVFFSDWRIQPLKLAVNLMRSLDSTHPVDLVLYGGDDVGRFGQPSVEPEWDANLRLSSHLIGNGVFSPEEAARGLVAPVGWTRRADLGPCSPGDPFAWYAPPLFPNRFSDLAALATYGMGGVIGNDCHQADRWVLGAEGCRDLHAVPLAINGWGIIGIEGAVRLAEGPPVGVVLYENATLERHLAWARHQLNAIPDDHLIIVSHAPPEGTLDFAFRYGLRRVGSPALADFVRRYQPALVLCGHVHSSGGRHESIGRTLVVNAASGDGNHLEARMAHMTLASGREPTLTWLDPRPHTIHSLHGIGSSRSAALLEANLETISDVYDASDGHLLEVGLGSSLVAGIRIQQLAGNLGQPVQRQAWPETPSKVLVYDIETELGGGEPWMIGAAVEGDKVHHWVALDQKSRQRRMMLKQFLAYVAANPGAVLCSWTHNDFDRRGVRAGLAKWVPDLLGDWDTTPEWRVLVELRRCLMLPNGMNWHLAEFAGWCGYQPAPSGDPELGGMQIGMMYSRYLHDRTPLPLADIQEKNAGDIKALLHVVRAVREHSLPYANLADHPAWRERIIALGSSDQRRQPRGPARRSAPMAPAGVAGTGLGRSVPPSVLAPKRVRLAVPSPEPMVVTLAVGNQVRHKTFGLGTVLKVNVDGMPGRVVVRFTDVKVSASK